MKNTELKLILKWMDVLDEINGTIEVNEKYWLILWNKKYGFETEKELNENMRKIKTELQKETTVFNL